MAQAHGDRLTAVDASFLAQEGPSSHMHVGAVMVFEGPPPGYVDFVNQIRARLHLVPRYRQKLAFPPLETGRPVWVDDPSFNLEYHVRHTALPKPGSEEQLRNLAARIHSQQLDRSKPLWETWLVQGLEDGRFALISKTHHAVVDGIAGVDLATVMFDPSPSRRPSRPRASRGARTPSRRRRPRRARDPRDGAHAVRARRARARRGAPADGVARRDARGARGRRRGRVGDAQPRAGHAAQRRDRAAPALRVPARGARGLQARQERVRRDRQRRRADRRLGRAAKWLRSRGTRTEGLELRALVPVSIRTREEQSHVGNRIAAMRGPLPVYVEDPVARLKVVARRWTGSRSPSRPSAPRCSRACRSSRRRPSSPRRHG